jgi:hypothetical protein
MDRDMSKGNIDPMNAPENAVQRAEFERMRASLPEAVEVDEPARFKPGIVVFVDGKYHALNPNVGEQLPCLKPWLERLLLFMPVVHRPQFWLERINRGVTLATMFLDSRGRTIEGVGLLDLVRISADQTGVCCPVLTWQPLDLTELASLAEAIAIERNIDAVWLWTPGSAPVLPGYGIEAAHFGQLQTTAVKIQ